MADQQVAIDITARDNASAAFRSVSDSAKKMQDDAKSASNGGFPAMDEASKSADKLTQKTNGSRTGLTLMDKSLRSVTESSGETALGLGSLGDVLQERITYPMQMATYAIEGAIAGLALFGIATYSDLQLGTMQMQAFTGSVQAGTAEYKTLLAMRSSTEAAPLASAYEGLTGQYGFSSSQANKLTKALANSDAVFDPTDKAGANVTAASATLGAVQQLHGLITGTQMRSLFAIDPNIYKQVASANGVSASMLEQNVTRNPATDFIDSNLLQQIESSNAAINGGKIYGNTLAGKTAAEKRSVSEDLAPIEGPLAMDLLHFGKDLMPVLGELAKFPAVSGDILGLGIAAVGLTYTVKKLKTLWDDLSGASSKIKSFFTGAEKDASAGGGCKECITCNGSATGEGEGEAEGEGAAAEEGGMAAGGAEGAAEAGGMGLADVAGPLAIAAIGAQVIASIVPTKWQNSFDHGLNMGVESAGKGVAKAAVDSTKAVSDAWDDVFGSGKKKKKTSTDESDGYNPGNITAADYALPGASIGTINITIPGAGNPEKVANAVPRNINDQIRAQQQRQTRRTGHPQYATNIAASRVRMN
jgi:hypothetical protein